MTDTADQLTGVGSTTYTFDAAGRRTRSSGTATRRFLLASTPGTDLESPHLVGTWTSFACYLIEVRTSKNRGSIPHCVQHCPSIRTR